MRKRVCAMILATALVFSIAAISIASEGGDKRVEHVEGQERP